MTKPKGAQDPAYSIVKHMLAEGGYLSQFINFKTCDHGRTRDAKDQKRSNMVLISVARQILHKCGFSIWWVSIPRSLPLPAVLIGVDVFHAPRSYDPVTKTRLGKSSCAAVVIQVCHSHDEAEVSYYSQTWRREAGQEYDLGEALEASVENGLRLLEVSPRSCIVWRDGVGDTAIPNTLNQELPALRRALQKRLQRDEGGGGKSMKMDVPIAFMLCQKRIATKLFFEGPQGRVTAVPPGTHVRGLEDVRFHSFYINGVSPPTSTPKPVRFVIGHQDEELEDVALEELSWALCHGYANWCGPIKVPSVCQMAHKLAEFAGTLRDCGETIDHRGFTNTLYFL
eukprot:CAMPEP_0116848152 /NCGR_PEP_ID=MMETSP0418-20121206/14834_1 /TAXON_ID=1158023 /ORGANISM="Astrosyne radiata, Strain 13vi08-1A" /LENGTH=339 /DNA_ID=CAMNT_0004479683 /DNA_START=179 /DNA_END=1198 /DNA_ORIENTATION=+